MNSEQYRQMLVRDGERRFREWHTAFLAYQRQFQQAMAAQGGRGSRPRVGLSIPSMNCVATATVPDAGGTDNSAINSAMSEQS